jgi:rfaE bifunctional protein kinase chain/domain
MPSRKSSNIDALFRSMEKLNVLVIGDVMLDAYLWGQVERISPEAPVPIVSIRKKENRLGGAANVAINIRALGATPLLCSVIGGDTNGRDFIELMQQMGMSTEGIVQSPERPTTVKTRVIGNNHQMLRVDEESDAEIPAAERKQLLGRIESFLDVRKVDVIVFEDYDKGVINKALIDAVVRMARSRHIPVAVDPKRRNFSHYRNVTLLKPNLKELRDGMKLDLDRNDLDGIGRAVHKLCKDLQLGSVLLTLSEKGILYSDGTDDILVPAHVRNIADVSGAGDTVISVAACCLAMGVAPGLLSALSNLAGGLVCEAVGVVPVNRDQLQHEAKRLKLGS